MFFRKGLSKNSQTSSNLFAKQQTYSTLFLLLLKPIMGVFLIIES
uniref:Uncharacterized protein n=1 Tax=Aegilops tauschii subsp. strangulata TaxID=200361 RepID=A0A453D167_AEGTS